MWLAVLALLAWLLAGPAALAAPPAGLDEPHFHAVGRPGDIPHGVVSALAQDRSGFLWLGTSAGLLRYDGYRFRPHDGRGADGKPLIGASFIRALLVGRDGRLWIGTESDGLASFDPATEQMRVFRSSSSDPDAVAAGTIRTLAQDRDGALWVGTIGHGLDRLDPASGKFQHHRAGAEPGTLLDDRVQSLLVDARGTLWVGTWKGLQRRVAGSDRFEPVFSTPGDGASLAGKIVNRLVEIGDGRIWAGTQQGELAIIDAATGDGRWCELAPQASGPVRAAVYDLLAVNAQQVWVGRASGIEVRSATDGTLLRQLRHEPGHAGSLAGNEVRALLRDRAGWVWAGGYGGGLQRHDPANNSIRVRQQDMAHGGVLAEANVRSVLQLANGEIWLGTQERGVAILDTELNVIGALRPDARDPQALVGGRVGSLAQTRDGTVWIGSDGGLFQVQANRRVQRVQHAGEGRARRLLAARDGGLWIATQDGLFKHEPASGRTTRLVAQGGQPVKGDVNALAEAADGHLWVGTEAGLYVLPPGAQALRRASSPQGQGLAHTAVLGLLIDRRQRLWVDTPAGLHRMLGWDGQLARFEDTASRHGFGGRSFGANLLEDERGRIWTHLAVFDPASGQHHELTPADGVDIGTGWFRSYTRTADGRMLFGGSRGLLVVRPEAFDAWSYAPPVVVSELRIDGHRRSAGELARGLVLAPQQRSLSLEFAALDYSDPGRLRYAWRLDGFDADWNEAGADYRVASYSNLSPGRYTLQVRGSNRNGVFNPQPLTIALEVQPAWWQTLWARALAALLLLALVAAVVQLRTALLRRQRLALELKVQQRTAELEAMSQALQRQTVALQEASLSDPLTGLRNRRFLSQHIETDTALTYRLHEARPPESPATPQDTDLIFFMVDLDHFKAVNDEHGHSAGDAVLVQTGQRLRQVFRDTDYLVRWGGEEFLIVSRATTRAHAPELAERARAMIADQPFELPDGQRLHKTCSVGFAGFPLCEQHPRALDWSAVIDVADGALYMAKRAGRNRWFGVLGAQVASAEALRQRARAPLAEWLASGELRTVQSP